MLSANNRLQWSHCNQSAPRRQHHLTNVTWAAVHWTCHFILDINIFFKVLSSSFKNDNRRICQVDILAAGIRPEQRAEVTVINSKYRDILRRDARLGQGYKHLYHQHQMREVRCYGDARWHSARQRVWSLLPLNNRVWKCLFMCSYQNPMHMDNAQC